MLWKNKLFYPGRNAQNGFILHAFGFLDVLIPMAQVLRLYIQVFLNYGLYVCIILETAHHRTTYRIFATLLIKPHLKKIAAKCSKFLQQLYFFLTGRSRIFFDKDQISSGGVKGSCKRGYGGEDQNGVFAKFPLFSETQT